MGILNNKLVGVLIYNDKIIEAIMCEEISTDISDLVDWKYSGFGGAFGWDRALRLYSLHSV